MEIVGDGVWVEKDCTVEKGATIFAPAFLSSGAHVCRGAQIMPFCHISRSFVGENTVVYSSTLIGAHVGKNCTVGPYAFLREGARVGDGCRIGDFVEIKASVLGNGVKAAHLSYLGDCRIGDGTNIGCGVVFANYDGKIKRASVVGKGCFIGCNSNLVAPLVVGDGAYIAAGTTLTRDLGEDDFCIGRARERVIARGAAGRYGARRTQKDEGEGR